MAKPIFAKPLSPEGRDRYDQINWGKATECRIDPVLEPRRFKTHEDALNETNPVYPKVLIDGAIRNNPEYDAAVYEERIFVAHGCEVPKYLIPVEQP